MLRTDIIKREWKSKIARHKQQLNGQQTEQHHIYARPNPIAWPITDAENMAVVKNFHTSVVRTGCCRCGWGMNPMEKADGPHFARCRFAQKYMAKKHWLAARQLIIGRLKKDSASRFSMGLGVWIKPSGFPMQIRVCDDMFNHRECDAIASTLALLWRHKDFAFLEDADAAADFCSAVECVTVRSLDVTFNFDRCVNGSNYMHVDLSNRNRMFDEYCIPADVNALIP